MNDIEFFKNFGFNQFDYLGSKSTDNSHGIGRHYIGYMKRGRGILTASDRTLIVEPGDMFYIPKGLKYHSTWIGDNNGKGHAVLDSIGFLYFPTHDSSGYMLQRIDYTSEEFDMYRPLSENKELNVTSIGQMYLFLGMIQNKLEKNTSERASDVVGTALMHMNNNHALSIPEYAHLCGVSESLLYQYFKEYSNESPNEARQRIACEKAINLLTPSNLSVEDICDRLQFSSSSYFRKIFYKQTGKTPREIRKSSKLF